MRRKRWERKRKGEEGPDASVEFVRFDIHLEIQFNFPEVVEKKEEEEEEVEEEEEYGEEKEELEVVEVGRVAAFKTTSRSGTPSRSRGDKTNPGT
ncbi:hypothetical protein V1477_008261 [Vespula maculifrons]|uniref:Uncharacterized protein n=1 Tax=Vespula maculifrons TaxID=7453 RepID=A0ABD2CCJ7_VESMC